MSERSSGVAPGTAVIALGGNALSPAGSRSTIHDQFRHTRESLEPIVDLARDGWKLCIVHGNGPQVGDELVRNELARTEVDPLPLGVLVASTAGWIGYMIQQSLENALRRAGLTRAVATIITQVRVDPDDPALRAPVKFIGHAIPEDRARALRDEGVPVKQDARGRWRRVVASPMPLAVHELGVIASLVNAGTIVIACGGGGAPIYPHREYGWEGIDAVIDKDLAAAVLARDLGASLLLILTDVDAVYVDFGTPQQRALPRLTASEAEALDHAQTFGAGSMAPKIRAAISFVRATHGRAIITELHHGRAAVRGEFGTTILPDAAPDAAREPERV
jgi:carbamate kinase